MEDGAKLQMCRLDTISIIVCWMVTPKAELLLIRILIVKLNRISKLFFGHQTKRFAIVQFYSGLILSSMKYGLESASERKSFMFNMVV